MPTTPLPWKDLQRLPIGVRDWLRQLKTLLDGFLHNELDNIQGGTTDEYYHLTEAQHEQVTESGDSIGPTTLSGTSTDITGIPSWARKITISVDGLSTDGTSSVIIQLGDSGGFETTNYNGSSWNQTGATITSFTSGFMINPNMTAATVMWGQMDMVLHDTSNTWSEKGLFGQGASARLSAGNKALSGTLTQIRFTTAGGVDTFDAGTVTVRYER